MSIIQIVSSQQPETNENSVESEPRVISRAEARRAHSWGSGGPSVKGSQEGHVTRSEFGDFEEGSGKRWPLLDWMRSKAGAGPQLRVSVVCFEKAGEIKSDWDAVAKSSARRERLAVHRTVCPSERREEPAGPDRRCLCSLRNGCTCSSASASGGAHPGAAFAVGII